MSVKELYGFIVVKCGVDPNYFLNEMQPYEVSCLVDSFYENYKNGWEQTRTIAHSVISSQSTKPIKPVDVLRFGWDDENEIKSSRSASLSKEDREELVKSFLSKSS